jgi:cytoskeletal protein RodZ
MPEANGVQAEDARQRRGEHRVSIGDALAQGRRQAGLTISQVSQRTRIRETIIRSIERGDFTGCGGDFYARGHIRSIAAVVGIDAEPLIAEYDATIGSPVAITAADVFQPVTPVRLRERRRPNWTAAIAVALALVLGLFAYQHFTSQSGPGSATGAQVARQPGTSGAAGAHHVLTTTQAAHHHAHRLSIRLVAVQNCWVRITSTKTGATIFSGMVYAGSTRHWHVRHAVTMIVGNPAGVTLTVNGKNPVPRGTVNTVTLSLHAGKVT